MVQNLNNERDIDFEDAQGKIVIQCFYVFNRCFLKTISSNVRIESLC